MIVNQTVSIEIYQQLVQEKTELQRKYNVLKHELEQLKRIVFGSKSERLVDSDDDGKQTSLLGELYPNEVPAPVEVEETQLVPAHTRKKSKHPGRTKLPDNIPVEDIIIEPDEDTTDMVHIGDEITETLDYIPGKLLKRRIIRRKYAAKATSDLETNKAAVVIGKLPARPIPKGIAEAGLLAHIMVAKFVDHLPFYRQRLQFKRNHDWHMPAATLGDWFASCCTLLKPLYELLKKRVLDTHYLQADESPLKVLDRDKPKGAHQGYMWVYRNPKNGLVFFVYRKGRGMNGPKEILADFTGLLQTDGYSAYKSLRKLRGTDIKQVSCLAHIRRKFFDARKNHKQLAEHALQLIKWLYAIENFCRYHNFSDEERQKLRDEKARPIYNKLLEWVNKELPKQLPKSPIGKALNYASNELPALGVYLDDPCIEIDNNLIENKIRPLALGRKNYMFAGSHSSAQRIAMMYSFFACCKALDVNPFDWLKHTLQHIGQHPVNDIDVFLPVKDMKFDGHM